MMGRFACRACFRQCTGRASFLRRRRHQQRISEINELIIGRPFRGSFTAHVNAGVPKGALLLLHVLNLDCRWIINATICLRSLEAAFLQFSVSVGGFGLTLLKYIPLWARGNLLLLLLLLEPTLPRRERFEGIRNCLSEAKHSRWLM